MKQEFQDSQTGKVGEQKVICRVLDRNTKVSACRKCCFDHGKMSETCDMDCNKCDNSKEQGRDIRRKYDHVSVLSIIVSGIVLIIVIVLLIV